MKITSLIDTLIANNTPFVCWFPLQSNQLQLVIDTAPTILQQIGELNNLSGFVVAPFETTQQTPIVLFQPKIHLKTAEDFQAFELPIATSKHQKKHSEHSAGATEFADYKNHLDKAITQLKNTDSQLSKIVLSRIIEQQKGDESLGQLLFSLKSANPNVFVYLVNLPNDMGAWLGATPETLLSRHNDVMQTMSLAGTQALRDDHDYRWRAKEIEEQAFVSRYTVDTLNRYGVRSYQTTGPENYETSVVAHLKTTFTFSSEPIAHCLGEFVADLSPTPAVCGLPKAQAKQWITENEPHRRDYYAGFLGEWYLSDNKIDLFVNIRCLRVLGSHYQLFTGSGITAKSDISAEWNETERKATTLLQVLKDNL